MLSNQQLTPSATRHWLRRNVDTSNLRNGVGAPWEIYRAGDKDISPILDVYTKSGAIGPYASYFGISPDLSIGFAILAHDAGFDNEKLDLNVYADLVSESLAPLQGLAGKQTAKAYAGTFAVGQENHLVLGLGKLSPGMEVLNLTLGGHDVKQMAAKDMGIKPASLDFRLYPTDVVNATHHQFVAVLQNKNEPADEGTPTCITWQQVGVSAWPYTFVFRMESGEATIVEYGGRVLVKQP